jgi:hypothetical protein
MNAIRSEEDVIGYEENARCCDMDVAEMNFTFIEPIRLDVVVNDLEGRTIESVTAEIILNDAGVNLSRLGAPIESYVTLT